jgi:hypothetical protein
MGQLQSKSGTMIRLDFWSLAPSRVDMQSPKPLSPRQIMRLEPCTMAMPRSRCRWGAEAAARPHLGCDPRLHLRFKTFNLEMVDEVEAPQRGDKKRTTAHSAPGAGRRAPQIKRALQALLSTYSQSLRTQRTAQPKASRVAGGKIARPAINP